MKQKNKYSIYGKTIQNGGRIEFIGTIEASNQTEAVCMAIKDDDFLFGYIYAGMSAFAARQYKPKCPNNFKTRNEKHI